jgi:predicted phage terminase large subunit-like protein
MPVKPKAGRRPDTVLVEAKANGQMLIRDLAKAGIIATPWNPDKYGDKIARVRLVTDLIENGRVWLPGQPPSYDIPRKFAEEFLDQCVAFPASDSRDMVDTMSMALMRLKVSGWVVNTDDPTVPTYDTPGERPAFY